MNLAPSQRTGQQVLHQRLGKHLVLGDLELRLRPKQITLLPTQIAEAGS